jgi:hypothetical protein
MGRREAPDWPGEDVIERAWRAAFNVHHAESETDLMLSELWRRVARAVLAALPPPPDPARVDALERFWAAWKAEQAAWEAFVTTEGLGAIREADQAHRKAERETHDASRVLDALDAAGGGGE